MADRSLEGMALPLEVRARLAELELELSEGNRPGRAAPRRRREAAAGRAGRRAGAWSRGAGSPRCGSRPPPGPLRVAAGLALRRGPGRGLEGRPGGPCPCARPRAAPAAQAGDASRRPACGGCPGLVLMRNLPLDLGV